MNVRVLVPKGRDPEEMWTLHVSAALLENRCPKCMGELRDAWGRPGWKMDEHGYWRRDPGGYEWRLGYNSHTGEPDWS